MRTIRRAFTLVELLMALAVLAVMGVAYWTVSSGGHRQVDQLEKGSELMLASTLLQEYLSWDLGRCLSLGTLAPEQVLVGRESTALELPVYRGYEGNSDAALRYRMLRYEFDAGAGVLRRDGKVILQEGLGEVRFRWTEGTPTMLVVELKGRSSAGREGGRFRIRLAAPAGTNGLASYRFAAHHRRARAGLEGEGDPAEDFGDGVDVDVPAEQEAILGGGEE